MAHTTPPHLDLLAEISGYIAKYGMSKTSFGTLALGDPRFVSDLEAGRECRRRTVERARAFMKSGAPSGRAPAKNAPESRERGAA
jgi:hypothetical protein